MRPSPEHRRELTTPQRSCLLAIFRAHPAAYETRGAATLAQRLCTAGLVIEVDGKQPLRRFQLTERGLARASRLATRRMSGQIDAILQARTRPAETPEPQASQQPMQPRNAPANWPFPLSAHEWAEGSLNDRMKETG